ncbi:DUF4132 domain-containing protein [Crossiella cryophila]|uniref:DUF4132 domain-containing protein n=1 Tax=Crossiella cryophila TaxID=43355 RepID=A0A7W7CDH1_9PSEU|nr:DUF4132 domain-containing protein [Crossiella cryophila]MBB4679180.1 hypothetical protein [Crossiella cryophila]
MSWKEHENQARELMVPLREGRFDEWARGLAGEPPERVGSALMTLVRLTAAGRVSNGHWWELRELVTAVLRIPFTVTPADAEQAVAVAIKAKHGDVVVPFRVASALARQAGSIEAIRTLLSALNQRSDLAPEDRGSLRSRLAAALPGEQGVELDLSVLFGADGWAIAVRADLAGHDPAVATAVLRQLATATGSKPTKTWTTATAAVFEQPGAVDVLRTLLDRVADAGPVPADSIWGEQLPTIVHDRNADLVRAAAWAAGQLRPEWAVPALVRVAQRSLGTADGWITSQKVPNSAYFALGLLGSAEAVQALLRLDAATRNNGDRKLIAAALTAAGAKLGLSPGQLAERMVDEAGFDADGVAELSHDDLRARVLLGEDLAITVRWLDGADWVAKPPVAADASAVRALKRRITEVKAVVAGERRRVEGLFAEDREWDQAEWRQYYLAHPITGRIAARLLWTVGETTGLPRDGRLLTLDGAVGFPAGRVRLWHPARAATEQVAAWRNWLLAEEFRQPFKQAFREVYLLTDAERVTGTYSNRFAAHVLRYNQTYALFKERGWVANYLGPYDGGYEGRARREFRDAGLTAVFEHFATDANAHGPAELCSTDRIWFHRTTDRAKTPLTLDEVPELVFAEAMRDADLFVGVCSIALDPNWVDRGEDPHFGYWQQVSFGELSARAQVRRDVLAHLLPKLAVADRVELTERFVRVRGELASYRVHLGSTNVLIEPDDRYLCIVPGSRGKGGKVLLPFDGDDQLSVILSKVLLLAKDDRITDPSILSQLPGRV